MFDFTDIVELLKWLVYSGGVVLAISKILELIPAFERLKADVKYWLNMALCVVASLVCYALLIYVPADVWAILNPWFLVVTGTILVYSNGQVVHKATKKLE